MKKSKNKFIISIIAIIAVIIGYAFLSQGGEKESSIVLIEGEGMLNNNKLSIQQREALEVGDTVKTLGTGALAILEWGDGSITRLGGNTTLEVKELYVSKNLGTIQLSFDLIEGKTWSNVISFLGEDSYFKESFRDNEASVRGTVFNIDLDQEYVYVTDHEVSITNTEGKKFVVSENKPFSLKTFSFIDLARFITTIKDSAWEELNQKIDKEFLLQLRAQLIKNIPSVPDLELEKLTLEQREEIYNSVVTQYQKLNFISPSDSELFKKKMELKNILLATSTEGNKESLISSTVYDLKDAVDTKALSTLTPIFTTLQGHIDTVEALNIDLSSYTKKVKIPQELQQAFPELLNGLKQVGDQINLLPIPGIDAISNEIQSDIIDLKKDAESSIKELKDLFSN